MTRTSLLFPASSPRQVHSAMIDADETPGFPEAELSAPQPALVIRLAALLKALRAGA